LGYWVAAGLVFVTTAGCLFSTEVAHFPYLLAFMAAVGISTLFGRGPGIVAFLLATLLSDLFFIPPVFRFTFNRVTSFAAICYALGVFLVLVAARFPVRKGFDQKIKLILFLLSQSFMPARNTGETRESGLLGRLDGEIEGEIFGWALETTEPQLAPTMAVYVEDRLIGEMNPVHYRPDVGSHSFYFDLSRCYPPASAVHVEVKTRSGARLANSPLILNIPAARPERHSETVLFMHISKTAGTAFREAMEGNYKQSEIAYLYPDPPGFLYENLALLPLQQRSNFRLIVGHFQYGIHQFLPQKSVYVTVVRDPVARVISEFRYLLRKQSESNTQNDSPLYLVELLKRREFSILDNHMVRCFSGVSEKDFPTGCINRQVYELAVHHLKTTFAFVGYQERSEEAYLTLQQRFNWKTSSLECVNAATSPLSGDYESVRATVEHFNRWDCELYSEIRRIFP
jgi:hypothetical protein